MEHEVMTTHARQRSRQRGIPETAISHAIDYGRHRRDRDADHFQVGWREVRHWARKGVDLSPYEGVHVVCASDGAVLTAYWR